MNNSGGGVTRIKYDKKIMKMLIIFGTASALLVLSGIVMLALEVRAALGFLFFAIAPGGLVCAAIWLYYAGGKMYFKRLKRYGYSIPESAKEYGYRLENVPREGKITEKSVFSKVNVIGSYVSFGLSMAAIILDVAYFIRWKNIGENAYALTVVFIIPAVIWLCYALALLRQSNKEKYRDDVEIDPSRKRRESPETIFVTVIILIFASWFAFTIQETMTKYIFESMLDADKNEIRRIESAISTSVDELCGDCDYNECQTLYSSYEQMAAGTEITDWGMPADALQALIADKLGISDYSELKDDFHIADSDAQIYVQIIDGKVHATLKNPIEEVSRSRYGLNNSVSIQ